MLAMCENLAAGLGAAVKPATGTSGKEKTGDAIGNAPLRTWVSDRSLGNRHLFANTSKGTNVDGRSRNLQEDWKYTRSEETGSCESCITEPDTKIGKTTCEVLIEGLPL